MTLFGCNVLYILCLFPILQNNFWHSEGLESVGENPELVLPALHVPE